MEYIFLIVILAVSYGLYSKLHFSKKKSFFISFLLASVVYTIIQNPEELAKYQRDTGFISYEEGNRLRELGFETYDQFLTTNGFNDRTEAERIASMGYSTYQDYLNGVGFSDRNEANRYRGAGFENRTSFEQSGFASLEEADEGRKAGFNTKSEFIETGFTTFSQAAAMFELGYDNLEAFNKTGFIDVEEAKSFLEIGYKTKNEFNDTGLVSIEEHNLYKESGLSLSAFLEEKKAREEKERSLKYNPDNNYMSFNVVPTRNQRPLIVEYYSMILYHVYNAIFNNDGIVHVDESLIEKTIDAINLGRDNFSYGRNSTEYDDTYSRLDAFAKQDYKNNFISNFEKDLTSKISNGDYSKYFAMTARAYVYLNEDTINSENYMIAARGFRELEEMFQGTYSSTLDFWIELDQRYHASPSYSFNGGDVVAFTTDRNVAASIDRLRNGYNVWNETGYVTLKAYFVALDSMPEVFDNSKGIGKFPAKLQAIEVIRNGTRIFFSEDFLPPN